MDLIIVPYGFNSGRVEKTYFWVCTDCKKTKGIVEKNPDKNLDSMLDDKGNIRVWEIEAIVKSSDLGRGTLVVGYNFHERFHCCSNMGGEAPRVEFSRKVCFFLRF